MELGNFRKRNIFRQYQGNCIGSKMLEKIFYDSSIIHFCSGSIGYRWAVKVTAMPALKMVSGVTDVLMLQELLERFFFQGEAAKDTAETLFLSTQNIMSEIVSVTVSDFDESYKEFIKYPQVSPRILLRTSVMRRKQWSKLCATFATGVEYFQDIQRVNLMNYMEEYEANINRL